MKKRTQRVGKSSGKNKTKMKIYSSREAMKIIRRNGWQLARANGGAHFIFKHPNDPRILTIDKKLNRILWERIVNEYNIDLNA